MRHKYIKMTWHLWYECPRLQWKQDLGFPDSIMVGRGSKWKGIWWNQNQSAQYEKKREKWTLDSLEGEFTWNYIRVSNKKKSAKLTGASFEAFIRLPAWVVSVTALLAGESSSFHLLEDLLCLNSLVRSDAIKEEEDGESFWFSFSASEAPSRKSNFWQKKEMQLKYHTSVFQMEN